MYIYIYRVSKNRCSIASDGSSLLDNYIHTYVICMYVFFKLEANIIRKHVSCKYTYNRPTYPHSPRSFLMSLTPNSLPYPLEVVSPSSIQHNLKLSCTDNTNFNKKIDKKSCILFFDQTRLQGIFRG